MSIFRKIINTIFKLEPKKQKTSIITIDVFKVKSIAY
jgi:hypothetical protein